MKKVVFNKYGNFDDLQMVETASTDVGWVSCCEMTTEQPLASEMVAT